MNTCPTLLVIARKKTLRNRPSLAERLRRRTAVIRKFGRLSSATEKMYRISTGFIGMYRTYLVRSLEYKRYGYREWAIGTSLPRFAEQLPEKFPLRVVGPLFSFILRGPASIVVRRCTCTPEHFLLRLRKFDCKIQNTFRWCM